MIWFIFALALIPPTWQAALKSEAVLPLTTSKYTFSLISRFLSLVNSNTSPSEIVTLVSDKIFKTFKFPNKDNYLVISAAFIILFLFIRSIVESSFAVFGIDSLIFFSSYFYIEQCYKKNKIW